MKTTQQERDNWRGLVSRVSLSQNQETRLLDDADRCAKLEAALREIQRIAQPTRRSGFALGMIRKVIKDSIGVLTIALNSTRDSK